MGARGVMKIESEDDLLGGFNRAKSATPSGEIIIEEYMEGAELSIDMLIYGDEIYTTGVADRLIEYPPFFIEIGHIMPSNLPQEQIDDAINVMKQGIRALGLKMGAAKGDIKITKDGAKVGEIAARLSGGFMSAYTYPLSSGVNLIKNAVEISLGEAPSNLTPKWDKVSVEKALIPGSGIVEAIEGIDEALEIDGVKEIFMRAKLGDILTSPTNNLEKAGNVIVVGSSRDEAIAIANKAIDTIKIKLTKNKSLTVEEIKRLARDNFNGVCNCCTICDGIYCRGQIHGIGSSGEGQSFIRNIEALNKYNFSPNLVHKELNIKTDINFFGSHLEAPIAIASVSNVESLGGIIGRKEYTNDIITSSINAGIISILLDNGNEDDFNTILEYISSNPLATNIVILKSIRSQSVLIKKLQEVSKAGANVVVSNVKSDCTHVVCEVDLLQAESS